MTEQDQTKLGKTLWAIADQLRGSMNADDFRDYMLVVPFPALSVGQLRGSRGSLSSAPTGPNPPSAIAVPPFLCGTSRTLEMCRAFEKQMRRKVHYVIKPRAPLELHRRDGPYPERELLNTLQAGFKYIENESFQSTFSGLFSEINLGSEKLGKNYADRNAKLCTIITKMPRGWRSSRPTATP